LLWRRRRGGGPQPQGGGLRTPVPPLLLGALMLRLVRRLPLFWPYVAFFCLLNLQLKFKFSPPFQVGITIVSFPESPFSPFFHQRLSLFLENDKGMLKWLSFFAGSFHFFFLAGGERRSLLQKVKLSPFFSLAFF